MTEKSIEGSKPIYDYKIERDVKIPMRDGIKLSAHIFLPEAEGRFPAILVRTPYGKNRSGVFWAKRGYVFMVQDVRGRFDSEGEWYPFINEAKDGHDTLEWIGHQPWSSGKVGMFGASYEAAVQFLLAIEGSPYLEAIAPSAIPGDLFMAYWRDGAFSLALNLTWLAMEVPTRSSHSQLLPLYDWQKIFRSLPLITLDEVTGYAGNVTSYRDYVKHSTYDDYWKAISIRHKHNKITVPVLLIDGWYDYYPRETFTDFVELTSEVESEEVRKSRKLLMGPWSHSICESTKLGEVDFGQKSMLDMNELYLRWFDYWLKGIDTGIMDEPPITIFVMGINEWREEREWPPARTIFANYYLHSKGSANSLFGNGWLSTELPCDEPPDKYNYDPENPVPTLGGNHSIGRYWPPVFDIIQPGPFDQRPIERRDDVLVYTSPPLIEDIEVTGSITLKLYAASSALDTDFVAKLIDVYPDGGALNITEGVIRARFRESVRKAPKLLEPGKIYEYTIELQPTSNVFKRGHSIRVDLTSSNFPLWDRNPNTGHEQGMDAEMQVAEQTIYHERKYPSHIILPIIPQAK